MEKQFYLLGGLPRSGSTVLASLLAQNPDIYTSPNSPLVNALNNVHHNLGKTEQAQAFLQPTQHMDVLRYMILGFYAFTSKPVIIDKSRSWPHPHNLALIQEVLQESVKLIATVRDLPSVLASFLRKVHEHPESVSFIDQSLRQQRKLCTDEARANLLFSPDGTVYEAWYTLKQAFDEGWGNRIHLVEYDDLVASPEATLQGIYDFLELPAFTHDFAHIQNLTPEDDRVYNLPGLHTVRPQLQKTAPDPQMVLGQSLYERYQAVPHFWRQSKVTKNPLRLQTLTQKSV